VRELANLVRFNIAGVGEIWAFVRSNERWISRVRPRAYESVSLAWASSAGGGLQRARGAGGPTIFGASTAHESTRLTSERQSERSGQDFSCSCALSFRVCTVLYKDRSCIAHADTGWLSVVVSLNQSHAFSIYNIDIYNRFIIDISLYILEYFWSFGWFLCSNT